MIAPLIEHVGERGMRACVLLVYGDRLT